MLYDEIKELVEGARNKKKKLKNNTYAHAVHEHNAYAIQLWNTDIATFFPDGSIRLNSGNYQTSTTRDRINMFTPICITQEKHVWYMSVNNTDINERIYRDNVVVYPDHNGVGYRARPINDSDDPQVKVLHGFTDTLSNINKLKRTIEHYVQRFVSDLAQGKIGRPSGSDCWYCALKDAKTGLPMGFGRPEHIISHIEEAYFVPSLLENAMKDSPMSMACKEWVMQRMAAQPVRQTSFNEERGMCHDKVETALRRYIYRHVGLAS